MEYIKNSSMRMVAFGDSITAGIGVPSNAAKWTDIISRRFGLDVINAGIGGNTTAQGLERMDEDVLSFKPHLITICFGMNDHCMLEKSKPRVTLEQFEENIGKMIDNSIKVGAIPLLVTPSYIIEGNKGEYYYSRHDPELYSEVGGAQAWLDMYAQVLRNIAVTMKVGLVDIRQKCEEYDRYDFLRTRKNDLTDDGVHPHALGAAVYAQAIGDSLEYYIKTFL